VVSAVVLSSSDEVLDCMTFANDNAQSETPTAPPKGLLRLVYIMGIVLVLLFLALIGGIVWKANQKASAPKPEIAVDFGLGQSQVKQMVFNGNMLAVTTDKELIVIDVNKRTVLMRTPIRP
jgi:amino acid transporter